MEESGGGLGVVRLDGAVEDGGGLEVDMGGGLVVLFIGGSRAGEESGGGGPCCKVTIYHSVMFSLSLYPQWCCTRRRLR